MSFYGILIMCYKINFFRYVTCLLQWKCPRLNQGDASCWTAEEENDRISMQKPNYIKSTLLSFLKVCLYGYYTNCQFYQISLFLQMNIVFHKISENYFLRIAY